ncbi:glutathionylspermidine synthase family protein [Allokutzneria sp. NRRL B-24872]|uniref:glutathionylspermidine synthase family protein n=1 Tax=Allokutzneria sp. NRRL B-24872 TaxID=1137961 RepID=UPI000A39C51D|nr:glutathionylspermidine synthase family protein [Allokutzneria sp. NRRL B-24872]
MLRKTSPQRPEWQETVARQGLVFGEPAVTATGELRPYWNESAHYLFEMDEVLALEADVELLHSMCLEAVELVVSTERYRDFAVPEWVWPSIAESWRRRDPDVYGRFDLRYDGSGPAKVLEYNADTPTSLLEAAVIQWYWVTEVFPGDDQWNSLHEKLVERWKLVGEALPSPEVHFAWSKANESGEDHVTVSYMQETAAEAGLSTSGLAVQDIGWDPAHGRFVDLADAPMSTVAKLYPWEWIVEERFGRQVVESLPGTRWIEPLWKMLLSNKALLAVLWEMYPGHPNLLPSFLGGPGPLTEYVRKPLLGREGANVDIVAAGHETSTDGHYGKEGHVYQEFAPLPEFDSYRPVLGAWTVGDASAGLGIRETCGLITDDGAAFVPHRVRAG